jgi:Uma2 family endonuclease
MIDEMQQTKRHYSVDEYFGIEEMSELRHEYFDGEIFAMSGGSRNHNQIAQNLTRSFDPLRNHGCRSYLADLRLKTPSGLYTYPDAMVICGPAVLAADRLETLTNPVVLAEVRSTSTRDYDRGQKFDLYRTIPALRDYLLVDQYAVDVEHRFLDGGRWESKRHSSRRDAIQLTGVDLVLQVDAIYDLVDFLPPPHHQ